MSIKIIYRPVRKNDKKGYLKIRIIENRRSKVKSLGIKITGTNWLNDKQRVSKKEPNAEKINAKIEEVLRDLNKYDTPSQALVSKNKTILIYYDEIISQTVNIGTAGKYRDIKQRFERYLNSVGLEDLKFQYLDTVHVQNFYKYMRENNCAQNTANYNIKSFKAIINKAIKSGIVSYLNNPFALLKLKYTDTRVKTLTADEVSTLINTEFKDYRKKRSNNLGVEINEFRDVFLFQIFAQGMRVSDIQLLQWRNFEVIEDSVIVNYSQFKTKKKIILKLTPIACRLLLKRLEKYDIELSSRIEKITFHDKRYQEELDKSTKLYNEARNTKQIIKIEQLLDEADGNRKEATRLSWEMTQEQLVERWRNFLKKSNDGVYSEYAILIDKLSKGMNVNDFVFHFFKNDEIFSNYKNGEELTKKQYSRMQGTRSYYNNLLKIIQKQAEINTVLSTHVARHTYTQLILNNKADVLSVSKALGHSHLSTTQNYISQLPNAKLLNLNDSLSDSFI